MIVLNVLAIHSSTLPYRDNFLTTTLKVLEESCKKNSIQYRLHMVMDYEPERVKMEFQEIEKMVEYQKMGDEDFDRSLQTLSVEQISNFFHQKSALLKILLLEKTKTPEDQHYYMIVEDDVMILPEFHANVHSFLKNIEVTPWDLLFLCVSPPAEKNTFDYVSVRELTKILPSKEAYCIQPSIVKDLLSYLEKIHYSYRIQLSRWIYENPSIRAMCPTKRVTLEGSKVGFLPSSVVENNILIYNQEFMELLRMMMGQTPMDFQKAKKLYKTVEHIQSPEIMHIYGVLLFKMDKKDQAKELFLEAVTQCVAKNGLISARSELLNNCINIHGMIQDDLEVHRRNPSKYEHITF
jgi:GR25 family glycosyltransferase involved in LPS biosynthesis